jgi:hypothetical protein
LLGIAANSTVRLIPTTLLMSCISFTHDFSHSLILKDMCFEIEKRYNQISGNRDL